VFIPIISILRTIGYQEGYDLRLTRIDVYIFCPNMAGEVIWSFLRCHQTQTCT